MKKFKEQLLIFTVLSFTILLSLSVTGCNPKNYSDNGEKSSETVSSDSSSAVIENISTCAVGKRL